MAEPGRKTKPNRYWALKIFFISFFLAAAFSIVAEYFTQAISIYAAFAILLIIVTLGVLADLVGVAFATCDQQPFVAMSAKRLPNAKAALALLKKADIVSNFLNDVIGDICGIVSGAAGAAIALQVVAMNAMAKDSLIESAVAIGLSSLIAAVTVAGKAMAKTVAMKKNKEIVALIGSAVVFFKGKDNV